MDWIYHFAYSIYLRNEQATNKLIDIVDKHSFHADCDVYIAKQSVNI